MGAITISPKTQKARGIVALANHCPARFSNLFMQQVSVYPHQALPKFPFFARPCPMKPRHGFVDSRMIRTESEWLALLEECAAANEPDFEVLMMPYIPATWSGILTPAGLTIGNGHDGATSGKGALQIPAASQNRLEFLKAFGLTLSANEGGITETPFLEFVEHQGKVEAVQLRNGPAVPLGNAYVPKTMVVKQVVKANGEDLMEWEQKIKQLVASAPGEGVVIWHPQGAMSSHYAVQAIEQSKNLEHPFAVLIQDSEPVLKTILQQTDNVAAPLSDSDYHELAKMLAFAITNVSLKQPDYQDAIHLAIGALHAQALWGGERHLLVLRAAALTFMLRFASAAILGELRHWKGGNAKPRKTLLFEIDAQAKHLSREQIYERAFDHHIKYIAPRMETAYLDFMATGWSASFGGKKWANCTHMTGNLFKATSLFIKDPTAAHWQEVQTWWNHTVNVFHNTGQLLNKFISVQTMDTLAKVPVYGLVSDLVGSLTVDAEDFGIHRDPAKVAELIHVSLPKIKKAKPKPLILPDEIEARWNCIEHGKLYLQIGLPFPVNRDYGLQTSVPIGSGLHALLSQHSPDGHSLSGSTTKKGKGVIVNLNGILILKVAKNDLWVPVMTETHLKDLVKQSQKGIVEEA